MSEAIATTHHALSLRDRSSGASVLRREKVRIATAANRAFLAAHPDWLDRFGDAATTRGIEDAGYHVEFLAGALESGEAGAFDEYVVWLLDVLAARGIDGAAVAESLGFVGSEVAQVVDGSVRDALEHLLHSGIERTRAESTARLATGRDEPTPSLGAAAGMFQRALLQGERQGALGIARAALRVAAHPTDVYVDVFQTSLENIGRLWQLNKITVAQEHLATAIVQFVLAQTYSNIQRNAPSRGTALVTGVQGELHQVGANLVADALELDGWNVRFLGTNVPHDGIIAAAVEMKVQVIAISATMLFNIGAVGRLVEEVRSRCTAMPRILVGGGAFRSAPQLWTEIGADGFAPDVRGACAIARPSGERA